MNPRYFLEKLGHILQESNIKPEIETFDAGMICNTIYWGCSRLTATIRSFWAAPAALPARWRTWSI